jgi:hypothetical protein
VTERRGWTARPPLAALRDRARRAWAWIDCGPRRLELPAHSWRDSYGRRWALWCDGAWIDPLTLPAELRGQLEDGTTRTRAWPAVVPRRFMDPPDELDEDRDVRTFGTPDACGACSAGHHDACGGTFADGRRWWPCRCVHWSHHWRPTTSGPVGQ